MFYSELNQGSGRNTSPTACYGVVSNRFEDYRKFPDGETRINSLRTQGYVLECLVCLDFAIRRTLEEVGRGQS
jgi:hypothetical protein